MQSVLVKWFTALKIILTAVHQYFPRKVLLTEFGLG